MTCQAAEFAVVKADAVHTLSTTLEYLKTVSEKCINDDSPDYIIAIFLEALENRRLLPIDVTILKEKDLLSDAVPNLLTIKYDYNDDTGRHAGYVSFNAALNLIGYNPVEFPAPQLVVHLKQQNLGHRQRIVD